MLSAACNRAGGMQLLLHLSSDDIPACRIDDHRAGATVWAGIARYINHSCAPNCYTKRVKGPDGVLRMGIYAKRDADLGEELRCDYKVRIVQ
jgi:hypothetical protein